MKVILFLVLGWWLPVAAFRAAVGNQDPALEAKAEGPEAQPQWVAAPAVHLGQDENGPLVPSLVPPPGQEFVLESREKFDFIESNSYQWRFATRRSTGDTTINPESNAYEYKGPVRVDQAFAELGGDFWSNFFGHRRTTVKNSHGVPLFQIHLTKSVFNPTRIRWSWRISHPISEKVLFTINKDIVGGGVLWLRDEWRVYRGRMRDSNQIYYVVGGYFGYGHQFFKTKTDWRRGVPAVAEASEGITRSVLGAPTVFSVKVSEGEDAALLLATTVIINMVHETEKIKADEAREEREREEEREEHTSSYRRRRA